MVNADVLTTQRLSEMSTEERLAAIRKIRIQRLVENLPKLTRSKKSRLKRFKALERVKTQVEDLLPMEHRHAFQSELVEYEELKRYVEEHELE